MLLGTIGLHRAAIVIKKGTQKLNVLNPEPVSFATPAIKMVTDPLSVREKISPSLSLDQTATTPDTDDDPDDFEYQEEGGEDMSITSEGTSDDRIDNEELSQLKQDLGMPALPTHNIDNRSEPNDLTDTSSYTANKELTTIVWTTDDLNSEQRGSSPEGLIKTHAPQIQKDYIRYLRLQKYDILCFQETHASTPELIQSLDIYFQAKESHWTPHVGILSFNSNFYITTIDTSATFISTRFQLCKVEHPQHFYDPFYILNIYAPAHSNKERREFFDKLTVMLYAMQEHIQ
ncbi:hypothetical protein G6F51_013414 [Rhizopus arrhizus]|uniref:Endonuclease/exonuclease/phosphatase domain-containing protein n=1 Tax=Rhizopus oryzae TaxID=64495 RepID=A0A9P7C228_RHIOR|nr:hypothetical protein G6F51_013414 [Rhizopus arrhizus]